MVVSCNNGTLSTFVPSDENPWDISKILLVNRRLGFGIKHSDIPVSYTHLTLPTKA